MYKTSGPRLSDALDTTLRRPDSALKDDWNLDDLALPGEKDSEGRLTLVMNAAGAEVASSACADQPLLMGSLVQVAKRAAPPSQT